MSFSLTGRINVDTAQFRRNMRDAGDDTRRVDDALDDLDGRRVTSDATVRDLASDDLREVDRRLADLDGETATAKVDADTSGFDGALSGLGDKVSDIAAGFGGGGGTFGGLASGAGVAGGIGIATAALGFMVDATQDARLEVLELTNLTGDTADTASRLVAVMGDVGIETKDLQDIILQMNGVLAESPELATQLGINLDDGKAGGERFVEVAEALNREITDATERGVIGSQLFGEEGVRQVNMIQSRVGDLGDALEDVGDARVFDDDDLAEAAEFDATIRELLAVFKEITAEIGGELIPLLQNAAELVGVLLDARDIGGNLAGNTRDVGDNLQTINRLASNLFVIANDVAVRTDAWNNIIGDAAQNTEELAAEEEELTVTVQDGTRAYEDHQRALQGVLDARRAAVDATFAQRNAQDRFRQTLDRANESIRESGGDLAVQRRAMDDAALSAADLADVAVRIATETAAANGETLNVAESTAVWNAAMTEAAKEADGPLRDAILEYIANVNDIPLERVTRVVGDLDELSIEEAQRIINQLTAPKTITFFADVSNIPASIRGRSDVALDRGGQVAGGQNALIAERRPEFYNGVLYTSPTVVTGPGFVTSGAETARILRSGESAQVAAMMPAPVRVPAPSGGDGAAAGNLTVNNYGDPISGDRLARAWTQARMM